MPHSEMGKAKMTASKTNGRVSELKSANKNATKDKCDESKWKKCQAVCKCVCVFVLFFIAFLISKPRPSQWKFCVLFHHHHHHHRRHFPCYGCYCWIRFLLLIFLFILSPLYYGIRCTDTLLFSRKHNMVNSTRHSHWLANHYHDRMNEWNIMQ